MMTDDGDANEAGQQNKNPPSEGVSKQLLLSSSWLDERELRVGMVFKDKAELVKAVELYSCRRQRKCYAFELSFSTSWVTRTCAEGTKKCKWNLKAEKKTEGDGCYEITTYNGPHTCEPVDDVRSGFLAAELEGLLKARPSLSVSELSKWGKKSLDTLSLVMLCGMLKRKQSLRSREIGREFQRIAQVHGFSLLI